MYWKDKEVCCSFEQLKKIRKHEDYKVEGKMKMNLMQKDTERKENEELDV